MEHTYMCSYILPAGEFPTEHSWQCKLWERARRGRLGAAFSELAAALPAAPPAASKIFILQRALLYIRELQAAQNVETSQPAQPAHKPAPAAHLGELRALQDRCDRLVQLLKRDGLSDCEPSALVAPPEAVKETNNTVKVSNRVEEITATNLESASKPKDCRPPASSDHSPTRDAAADEVSDSGASRSAGPLRLTKKKVARRKRSASKAPAAVPRGPVAVPLRPPAGPRDVWVSVSGAPLLLPLLLPPPPPTYLLLQRPAAVPAVGLTRTTAATKVPIPACSSAASGARALRPVRVTQLGRRRLLKSLRAAKSSGERNDKENGVGREKKKSRAEKSISLAAAGEKPSGESRIVLSGSEGFVGRPGGLKVDEKGLADLKNENPKTFPGRMGQKTALNDSGKALPVSKDSKPEETLSIDVLTARIEKTYPRKENISESLVFTGKMSTDNSGDLFPKPCLAVAGKTPYVPINFHPEESDISATKKNKLIGGNVDSSGNVHIEGVGAADCQMELGKGAAADMAADLLASLGASRTSPPTASPLAASPTAAFLLAFPLVCAGPRPDTPLHDNLQTPNICSLDNFSTFFSTKESSSGANFLNSAFLDPPKPTEFPSGKTIGRQPSQIGDQNFGQINRATAYGADSASACAYSDGNLFQPVKAAGYSLPDSIFSYEHTPVMNGAKTVGVNGSGSKSHNYFENFSNQPNVKGKISNGNENGLYVSMVTTCTDAVGFNGKPYGAAPTVPCEDLDGCRKLPPDDGSNKFLIPGVVPDYSVNYKTVDGAFPSQNQGKMTFQNSSHGYPSCNAYNPFGSEFPVNSTGVSKASTSYFPDFNAPYVQNCNIWAEESAPGEGDFQKNDFTRKFHSDNNNQMLSSNVVTDFQPDFRFPFPVTSKSSNMKTDVDAHLKGSTVQQHTHPLKYSAKEIKEPGGDGKIAKVDYSIQRGTVNWMTSEVNSVQSVKDPFSSSFGREIKREQNSVAHQPFGDAGNSELPFYHIRVGGEEQQGWGPCKLPGEPGLPTLVGDLALGVRKRPARQPADKLGQQNFLSVSQLMERGEGGPPATKPPGRCAHKRASKPPAFQPARSLPFSSSRILPSDEDQFPDNKLANRNNYSAEALIQNDRPALRHNRRVRPGDSRSGQTERGVRSEDFAQNRQFDSYLGVPATVSSYYPTAGFATSSGAGYASGFPSDSVDYLTNPGDNIFYVPKMDAVKAKPILDISDSGEVLGLRDATKKAREPCKKEFFSPAKRVKRVRGSADVAPATLDDSFFGYFSSSQMHPYPAAPRAPSPAPGGTSLTNFNLSTIFPEINKRPGVGSFPPGEPPAPRLGPSGPRGASTLFQ